MIKTKYVPDLSKQMALCEANYVRLLKLMPDFDLCDEREFIVDMANERSLVRISVQERFKFTSTLLLTQDTLKDPVSNEMFDVIGDVFSPKLLIRLYHDAKMAEVVSPVNASQLKGKYKYPNDEMYQVDEKMQLNDYLAQWLSQCLKKGYLNDKAMAY